MSQYGSGPPTQQMVEQYYSMAIEQKLFLRFRAMHVEDDKAFYENFIKNTPKLADEQVMKYALECLADRNFYSFKGREGQDIAEHTVPRDFFKRHRTLAMKQPGIYRMVMAGRVNEKNFLDIIDLALNARFSNKVRHGQIDLSKLPVFDSETGEDVKYPAPAAPAPAKP